MSRASGILLHPTALPGPHGSGDFGADAYRFVDWLAAAGQSLWQVLPLGEIGPGHSPYMSRSAFAGNVLLIDLCALVDAGWLLPEELPTAGADPARVDYPLVIAQRMATLRCAQRRFVEGAGAGPAEFAAFCAREADWLDDYALFMALCARQGEDDWTCWPAALARREAAALASARTQCAAEIAFWCFCQWCFDTQWQALRRHANARGVRIVGDMPIFVAHQSADVWAHRELFDLDGDGLPRVVAGVPPDYFSATGQRWGNPLYRWQTHAERGYDWWRARLRRAQAQFDLLRIDHFRGFCAHWEIAADAPTAVAGRWVAGPGAALFEALIDAVGTLDIIAEDLGDIDDEVHALRDRLGLPGMRVLQFAFGGDATHPFLPHNYVPNTLAYLGTHDNDTFLGWWHSAPARERAFVQHYLGSDGRAIHWDAIWSLSASVAERMIVPLQDVLGLGSEARFNSPGEPDGNWGWRFEWTQLQDWFAPTLAHIAAAHGRAPLALAELPAGA